MQENEQNSNEIFYGSGASTSDITPAELELLEKAHGVQVRDGDEYVEIELPPKDGEETPADEEPKDNEEKTPKEPEDKDDKEEKKEPATIDEKVVEAAKEISDIGDDLTKKGVDVNALLENLARDGKFSDADYAALEKAGYPKTAVNAVLRGQVAVQQEAANAMIQVAGGEEAFGALSEFAQLHDQEAMNAFNAAFERGDLQTAKVVLQGIKHGHKAMFGTANRQVQGGPKASAASAVKGFASQDEMVAAMSDPRYARDAAYSKSVEARVAASKW